MQFVDYHRIVQNAQYFKSILGRSKLCAVVKNDAYGHGLVRTAAALAGVVDCFAVGSVAEALKIAPFAKEVLLLLPPSAQDVEWAVEHNFVLTVDSFATLDRVAAHTPRGTRARIHIKIDSGMHRLGFAPTHLPRLAEALLQASNVQTEGVFSHFYGETVRQCNVQLQLFQNSARYLSVKLCRPLCAHIANTSATLLSPKYHLDMVRVGLGLYGYGCANLHPAKTVTATVIALQQVAAGQCVGYAGAYVTPCDTTLAVLDIGYANGFPRAIRGAKVQVGNNAFPIVGNVCMAMCLADVGNAQISVGQQVVVLGEGLNNANNDVIIYELLCNLK